MQITSVRIHKVTNNTESQKLRALVSVVFDGQFVLHDVRVIEGVNGLFVSMPRRKTATGEYKDLAHPVTAEARNHLNESILTAYAELEAREKVELKVEEAAEAEGPVPAEAEQKELEEVPVTEEVAF